MLYIKCVPVCVCVFLLSTVARAEICPVDLEELTNDSSVQYNIFFGQVESRTSGPPAIALCLGRVSDGDSEEIALETELVAYADTSARGSCTTVDYSSSCGSEGCDSFESIVWRKDTVSLGIPERGLRCYDTFGLLDEEGGEVVLSGASEHNSVYVTDTLNDAAMGLDGTRGTCTIGGDDTYTWYGRGYTKVGSWWIYSGSMFVCSGDASDLTRVCSVSSATMESAGVVMIVGNDEDNLMSVDYAYSTGLDCNDGDYRVHWWDDDWLRGVYLWGDEGDDTLIGSPNDDYIYGLDGADTLVGAGGDDYIRGYGGNDYIIGDSTGLSGSEPGEDGDDDYCDGGSGTDSCPGGDCCEIECEDTYSCDDGS